ncbi:922_t:CDS:2 [Ambispora gerdemannii]|uniref:922_t:CDS:1 n=1 Tax=Ambispora gerdemannii TaxID=144530 RepID=A0A9N9CZA9_9GLOM|nr:922_t:CDS:2 [Ambispora gerdemannii]
MSDFMQLSQHIISPTRHETHPTLSTASVEKEIQRSNVLIIGKTILLSFGYSNNCNHKFSLEPHTDEFEKKILKNTNKKTPNCFMLFRTCFSNSAANNLHCKEQLCPLSENKFNYLRFISKISKIIWKTHKDRLFDIFSKLYDELKAKKTEFRKLKPNNMRTQYSPFRDPTLYTMVSPENCGFSASHAPIDSNTMASPKNMEPSTSHASVGSSITVPLGNLEYSMFHESYIVVLPKQYQQDILLHRKYCDNFGSEREFSMIYKQRNQ